jgi:Antitoxin SocA-like, Panacea domain
MLSRNAQVLRYLLEVAPGVGRIKLVKFAYLADCEAHRYIGRSISEFEYRFAQHGPFDKRFYDAKNELIDGGCATETLVESGPYTEYEFRPTAKLVEYGFDQVEVEILRYVAAIYLSHTARSLCDEVVYQTPPMEGAKVGDHLKLEKMRKGKQDKLEFDLERLLASEASVDAGRYRSLREAVDELRASDNS